LLLFLLSGLLSAEVPSAVAITDARVVTVSGPVIEKGTVVVRGGLIEAVGARVAVPADAWEIDGAGLTVYPGLIDGLSTLGIPKEEKNAEGAAGRGNAGRMPESALDRPQTTSWVRAADLVQPTDKRLEASRKSGFTTAVTFPTKGIFGGQGAVVNLAGKRSGNMVVVPSAGQYVTLATSNSAAFPASLMGTIAYIRQVYLDAGRYQQAKAIYAGNPSGMKRPVYDRALEGVLANRRVLLPATRSLEIKRMLRLSQDLDCDLLLYGLHGGYEEADLLKQTSTPVLVSLDWPKQDKEADPEREAALRELELRENAPSTPKALTEAGVLWGFYSGGLEKPAEVIKAVKQALDAGLQPADAVRAMTLSVAEIYAVDDRLGSIDTGKIANLVVTDGELFGEKTRVKHLFIDGVKFTMPDEPVTEEKEKKS